MGSRRVVGLRCRRWTDIEARAGGRAESGGRCSGFLLTERFLLASYGFPNGYQASDNTMVDMSRVINIASGTHEVLAYCEWNACRIES
jgi:hypothetical protein